MIGRLGKVTCDACRRPDQRCERLARSGIELWVCVDWRGCIAAQPPREVLLAPVNTA